MLSSNITNIGKEILITCISLKDCEKFDTNGEQDGFLGIVQLEKIEN